jgi:DNA-binding NtrC family response regulator
MAENLTRLLQGAKGGTVFFDELTDIPPVMQKLVLEAFIGPAASGGHRPAAADVQLIASSNKDVDEALANGVLNEALRDLFAGATIKVPPLRERREDICLLINHFFNLHKNRNKTRIVGLSPHAMDVLLSYHWPGNVIQLENVIERAFALGVEAMIEMEDLPAEIRTFGEISMM